MVNIDERWEQTRMMCFWMGNHKFDKPEDLFPLDVDRKRLEKFIDSGKAKFATIREQTPEEKRTLERITKINRGR
jgi:hypothetical protein